MTVNKIPTFIINMANTIITEFPYEDSNASSWRTSDSRPDNLKGYDISMRNSVAPISINDGTFKNIKHYVRSIDTYNDSHDKDYKITEFKVNNEELKSGDKIEVGDTITFKLIPAGDRMWSWKRKKFIINILFGINGSDSIQIPINNS